MSYSAESNSQTVTACVVRPLDVRDDALVSLLPSNALTLVEALLSGTPTDLRTLTIMQPDVVVLDFRHATAEAALRILGAVRAASRASRIVSVGAAETPEFVTLAARCNVRRYGSECATPAVLRRAVLGAAADLNCRDDGRR